MAHADPLLALVEAADAATEAREALDQAVEKLKAAMMEAYLGGVPVTRIAATTGYTRPYVHELIAGGYGYRRPRGVRRS